MKRLLAVMLLCTVSTTAQARTILFEIVDHPVIDLSILYEEVPERLHTPIILESSIVLSNLKVH